MPGSPVTETGNGVGFTSGVVSVGATSQAIVGDNPARKGIILQNIHATQDCDIKIATASTQPQSGVTVPVPTAPTAEAGKGFRLHSLTTPLPPLVLYGYTGPIAGIATGASTSILVTEW